MVSHRADHGRISPSRRALGRDQTAGRLHNDTAYGLTGQLDGKGNSIVVRRVPLTTLKSEKDLAKVRDPDLRRALEQATRGQSGKAFEQALNAFSSRPGHYQGIHRLRITGPLKVIGVLGVWSRHLMGWIESEALGVRSPYFADVFVWGEASEGFEPASEIVG